MIWFLKFYVLLNSQDVGLAAGTGDEGYFVPPVKGTSQSQVITQRVCRYRMWWWLHPWVSTKSSYWCMIKCMQSLSILYLGSCILYRQPEFCLFPWSLFSVWIEYLCQESVDSCFQVWCTNSQLAVDHVLAGSFESAMRVSYM